MLNFCRYKGEHKEFYLFFKNVLGFTPRNTELYQIAFIHKSKSLELGQGRRVNNERLEYLGDAVLSAIVAEYLYKKYPNQGEGFLTEMRSKLVSRANLNKLAHKIGLSQLIQYNRESQGIFKSIDGDAFEALIGAIYLEKGYRFTRRVIIKKIIANHIDVDAMAHTDWNFKSKLIDWGQKNRRKVSFEVERVIYQAKRAAASMMSVSKLMENLPNAPPNSPSNPPSSWPPKRHTRNFRNKASSHPTLMRFRHPFPAPIT